MQNNKIDYYEVCIVTKDEEDRWIYVSSDFGNVSAKYGEYYAMLIKESMLDFYWDEEEMFSQTILIGASIIDKLYDDETSHNYTVLVFDSYTSLDRATDELDKYIEKVV